MLIARLPPATPLYSTLSNIKLILDATGLRDNVSNGYGEVSGGAVQEWHSISPGDATMTFDTAPVGGSGGPFFGHVNTLKFQDGYIEFPGYVLLGATQSTLTNYNFISYNATFANLKWTLHMVLKIGQDDHPNWIYGLFGTNGRSAGNKGASSLFEDRFLASRSDGLTSTISKGSAGFILSGSPDDLITPNVPFVLTIETDCSLTAADRQKYFINGTQFAHTATSASTAVSSGQTYTFEIGAAGNDDSPFRGWMSHFILQSGVESSGTRNAFINSLIPYTRKSHSNYFYNVDESRTYSVYHTLNAAGRYYFGQALIQHPSSPNTILKIYHDGDVHVYAADKKIAAQKSTDRGRTWGAQFDVYDPDAAGAYAIQDGEWGYSSDGTVHGLVDSHDEIATPGGDHKLIYITSTDDLSTTTVTDITAQIPADGLAMIRAHGKIVENNGYLYACLYKQTEEDDNTNVAIYLMRKPVGAGTTWTFFLVDSQASATLYLNEQDICSLDTDTLLMLARNETSEEFRQYRITTASGTPGITDDGNASFGETFAYGSPPLLSTFNATVNGTVTPIVAMWLQERGNAILKVVYAKASALLASGVSGWDLDTKFTVVDDTQAVGYGGVCHYNNNFNAIGAMYRDPGTLTENTLITFHCPATNYYATIIEQLGL